MAVPVDTQTGPRGSEPYSVKAVVAACVVLTRYLADRDPTFGDYLSASLRSAEAAALTTEDLAVLRLLATATSPHPGRVSAGA